MSVTINGTTGVSLVQDGAITSANLPAGSVIQVVSAVRTPNTATQGTTTNTWIDTNLSASITPISASSKILVLCKNSLFLAYNPNFPNIMLGIKRAISGGSTTTGINPGPLLYLDNRASGTLFGQQEFPASLQYLDSPGTTSAITYTIQYYYYIVSGTAAGAGDCDPATNSIQNPPTLTLMEVAA